MRTVWALFSWTRAFICSSSGNTTVPLTLVSAPWRSRSGVAMRLWKSKRISIWAASPRPSVNYRAAMACLRSNVAALEGDRLREQFGERYGEGGVPNLQSRSWLGRCLAECGAFGDALALAEGVMHTSERSTQPFTRVAACRDLGHVYLWRGDVDKAISL